MSNTDDRDPTGTPTNDGQPARKRRTGLIAAVTGAVVLGGLALGAAAVSAHGDRGWGRHGPVSIEAMQERAQDKIAWIAGKVDASEAQQQELEAIANALVADMAPLIEQHREHRRDMITELTRPTFDRTSVESVRRDMIATLDTGSARLADALAEASEVLTPEQRQTLTERMTRRMRH